MSAHRNIAIVTAAVTTSVIFLGGCGDDGPDGEPGWATFPSPPVGLEVETLAEGLARPTQIASDGRGGYVVAELNGSEGGRTGRVLQFDTLPGEPTVLVDGLRTPTGVAVDGDLLWIMEQRTLSAAPFDEPGDRRIVLDDLPFNGRSEGTLSAVPGGGVLFDTSGRRAGDGLVEGSGTLWYLAGPDADPEPFATGFKHAYAHAPLGDGRWLVTEISDGRLDGEVPPDELVIATDGDDFGYPRCVGDGLPVLETGGTDEMCASAPGSVALFEPGSTPTGVAIAPWDPDMALVALWNEGAVVAVPIDAATPLDVEVVYGGADHPQHLMADGRRVLLTDHAAGRIVSFTPASGP
jgi:hypothetical protein